MATNTAGRMCSTLLVALVVLSAREGDADAFCRRRTCGSRCELDSEQCPVGGEPLRWPSSTLSFALHSNIGEVKGRPAEVYAAIRTAIHVWSDTECPLSGGGTARTSLRFRELEREEFAINAISSKSDAYKLRNVILFRSGGWPYAGRDDESEADTIASARARFDSKTGLVRSQQIEMNEAGYEFRLPDQAFAQSASERAVDLVTVVTHEVGHFVGLAHSLESDSIMAARYCEQGSRCQRPPTEARRLAGDDVIGLCSLFPPGQPSAEPEADTRVSTDGCSASPSKGASGFALYGLFLGLGLALFRRVPFSRQRK
jgi:hypothetical protein